MGWQGRGGRKMDETDLFIAKLDLARNREIMVVTLDVPSTACAREWVECHHPQVV